MSETRIQLSLISEGLVFCRSVLRLTFVFLTILFFLETALPLPASEQNHLRFIRNSYQSLFSREPRVQEYDRWLKFLEGQGEKSRMLALLKESNEFFERYRPAAEAVRLSVTVYSQPEIRSLRAGTLMPGDRFRVTGRARDWYKIENDHMQGWVERDGVDIVYEMQKIGRATEAPVDSAEKDFLAAESKLHLARNELLTTLLMDDKASLFQFRPGQSIQGDQALRRYREILRETIILRKVRNANRPQLHRALEICMRGGDLFSYEVLQRLDRSLTLGAEQILIRSFERGYSLFGGKFLQTWTNGDDSKVLERWQDELKRRDLKLGFSLILGDFGEAWSREHSEFLARNGAGFASNRHQPSHHFVDPLLPEIQELLVQLVDSIPNLPDLSMILLDGLFPAAEIEGSRDLRTHFVFNPRAVAEFEKGAGFPVAGMDEARENVYINWRRSQHLEFLHHLHRRINARRIPLLLATEHPTESAEYPWARVRDLAADFLLIPRERIDSVSAEGSMQILVSYRLDSDQPLPTDLDEDVLRLQEQNPRIAGWLVREKEMR